MKVVITQTVRHDGKRLSVGDVVDLKEAQAQALVACGSAELQAKKPRAAASTEPDPDTVQTPAQPDGSEAAAAGTATDAAKD